MGRLSEELCTRAELFSDQILDLVETLQKRGVFARVIDQMVGCGTSVGANICEADQALSSRDFCKALGTVLKESSECRFWLRTCARRGWATPERTKALEQESTELSRIFGSMVTRTRAKDSRKRAY